MSDRVTLNTRYSLQIIHGYAPMRNSEDENAEIFYENLKDKKKHFVKITGDFKAKTGTKDQEDPHFIGQF